MLPSLLLLIHVSLIYLAGEYTVVASTFEADLIGKFIMTVSSTTDLHIEPIPAEGAVRKYHLAKKEHWSTHILYDYSFIYFVRAYLKK